MGELNLTALPANGEDTMRFYPGMRKVPELGGVIFTARGVPVEPLLPMGARPGYVPGFYGWWPQVSTGNEPLSDYAPSVRNRARR
jgi:hypothetical protein